MSNAGFFLLLALGGVPGKTMKPRTPRALP